jgi:Tol biopolymer transport system component
VGSNDVTFLPLRFSSSCVVDVLRISSCSQIIFSLTLILIALGSVAAAFAEDTLVELLNIKVHFYDDLKGRLAFITSVQGKESIFIADFDDKRIRPIIAHTTNQQAPHFTPDGRTLIFLGEEKGSTDVFSSRWPHETEDRISTSSFAEHTPLWLNTTQEILTTILPKQDVEGASRILALNPLSGVSRPFATIRGKVLYPSLNFRSTDIAYSTNRKWPQWDICMYQLSTKKERCLVLKDKLVGRARFAKQSDTLVFSRGDPTTMSLALYSGEDSTPRPLTDAKGGRHYDAEWIGNDQFIVYAEAKSDRALYQGMVVKVSSGEVRPLIEAPYSVRSFSWTGVRTMDLEIQRVKEEERILKK